MLRSMTAFGRASKKTALGHFFVEIQSVNRKHLEINCQLPREFSRLDGDIRKQLSAIINRGQVFLHLTAIYDQEIPLTIRPNLPLARQLKRGWQRIAEEIGFDFLTHFSLHLIANEPALFSYSEPEQEEDAYKEMIGDVVALALEKLMEMKDQEGQMLQTDISKRMVFLQQKIAEIEVRAPEAPAKYRQKLIERLEEVLQSHIEEDERLLREVAIFAEKVDITEEITRIQSHLKQMEEMLASAETSMGKTLDFFLQELIREVNTIGSKSTDIVVSQKVIEVKSEIEKIREQVQNVE